MKSQGILGQCAVSVTPHAGVRIEIIDIETYSDVEMSPPTRGCELKYALAM